MGEAGARDPVTAYAEDVLEGRIIAGELVQLACERHMRDLENPAFVFDWDRAKIEVNFASWLVPSKGNRARRPLELMPWQKFRHGSVFGWFDAETGARRFRESYHQVAKKNGKTTDTAVPALYAGLLDEEPGADVFCAATTRKQAGMLFNEIKSMAKNSGFTRRGLVRSLRGELILPDGEIKTLSRDGENEDGLNPHLGVIDEFHLWRDQELADVLRNSTAARFQPHIWAITTAGQTRNSICGTERIYCEKILRQQEEDDRYFAFIAEPPEDCDVADPAIWAMANPGLGVTVQEEFIRGLVKTAQINPSRMPGFRRYHLNLWTSGASTWIKAPEWDACANFDLSIEDLAGQNLPAFLGVDLSRTTDMTAVAVAVPYGGRINVFCFPFLAARRGGFFERAQRENRDYVTWRDEGWLEVHETGAIDEDRLLERLTWIDRNFDVREAAFDRWGMVSLREKMLDAGMPLVDHGQGTRGMSAPMKEFEAGIVTGRLQHDGNPVLAWAVGNTVASPDPAEGLKPNKNASQGRIDPAVAAIMAYGRAVEFAAYGGGSGGLVI